MTYDIGLPKNREPVTRRIVLDARFEELRSVSRIEVREIHMVAGLAAGLHVHNGPVLGNIVKGVVAFQIEGQPVQRLEPGDVFFEPEGARIARFDALDEDVTFLGYFPLGEEQEPEIEILDA